MEATGRRRNIFTVLPTTVSVEIPVYLRFGPDIRGICQKGRLKAARLRLLIARPQQRSLQ
jgi:hypothetical protein